MEPLLRLEHVSKSYPLSGKRSIQAVRDVSLEIFPRETLGVVGESGCGKSTLAKIILGVYPKVEGKLYFHGQPLHWDTRAQRLAFAEKVQMIFQDPYSSFNPRMRVEDIVVENLVIHQKLPPEEKRQRVHALLEEVGLQPEHARRFPGEFSGGQRQRIGIARALALRPELLVCDEPISALDVSIQSQIMNLLKRLGKDWGLTYLFIAHDLNMVRYISDRVAVMFQGHIVELAPARALYQEPFHPYTRRLSQAVLAPTPHQRERVEQSAQTEYGCVTLDAARGCPYVGRCTQAVEICAQKMPDLQEMQPGHFVACHHVV